jgi:hypothetical protein
MQAMIRSTALLAALLALAIPEHAATRRRTVAPLPPATCPTTAATLASGFFSGDIEVDNGFVYFGDEAGGLFRVLKGGGEPQRLATLSGGEIVFTTALDDASVFFLAAGDTALTHLYSVPKTGGTPMPLATIDDGFELAVDATSVYWTAVGTLTASFDVLPDGKVERAAKDGSGRTVLADNLNAPTTVAVDETNVYFGESGLALGGKTFGLRVMPKAGGTIQKITQNLGVTVIGLSPTDVYFAPFSPTSGGALARVPKGGGTVAVMLSGIDLVTKIIPLGDRVYFFDEADVESIVSVGINGGPVTLHELGFFSAPQFAVDGCSIYSVDSDADVDRIPR